MAQLYRDTFNIVNNELVEEGLKVDFPELENTARTSINKALKSGSIPSKENLLEYVYYNDKEWLKAKSNNNPGEMK